MSLSSEIEKIGLSEKEAKVYLAALELGQSSVQEISKKSNINRATTYVALDSLINKGLSSTFQKGKKTFYIANSPEFLLGILEVQKNEINEIEKNLKKIMPEIESIYNRQVDRPTVRFFQGKEGIVSCISEFLADYKSGEERVRMIYSNDRLDKIFNKDERDQQRKIRLDKKIKSKALYNYKNGEIASSADGKRIKVDEDQFPIFGDIGVYEDSIRMHSLGKRLSSILIRDRDVANTFKTLFDLAWEGAEAREKKKKK